METLFSKYTKEQNYWTRKSRILVAVSGGVDSVVLLDLLRKEQQSIGYELGVVHINHQLRPESIMESNYLRQFCQEAQLPFYETKWETPEKVGMEAAARTFRYSFFSEIMAKQKYTILVTAHHGDDQIETILMKVLRGGSFQSFAGIRDRQPFASGELIRPLLPFSKQDLYEYANERALTYFEDSTNQELSVQRNRLRQRVLPYLKEENQQAIAHFNEFSTEITRANRFISQQMDKLIQEQVKKSHGTWIIPAQWLDIQENDTRLLFFKHLFDTHIFHQTSLSKNQLTLILNQWKHKTMRSQWHLDLTNHWKIYREYDVIIIEKKAVVSDKENQTNQYQLLVDQPIWLNKHQWVGLFSSNEKIISPVETKTWNTLTQDIWLDEHQKLKLRKRENGDRIALNEALTKKVNRIFIDRKIPMTQRDTAWILCDEEKTIYGVLPFVFSYLSIASETDKIHYILLYKYE